MTSFLQAVAVALLVIMGTGPACAEGSTGPSGAALDHTIARALEWIEAHPASPEDGGLEDMIDEAVFYRVVQRLAERPEDRDRLGATLKERLSSLERSAAFGDRVRDRHKTLLDDYHLALAAHLMQTVGMQSVFQQAIVEQAAQALAAAPQAPPTFRLTLSLLLGYLGRPQGDRQALLAESLIARVTEPGQGFPPIPPGLGGQAPSGIAFTLYALVHEVVALTDFGYRPLDPWLSRRRDALAGVFTDAARWAGSAGQVDLFSELALTLHLLGEPLRGQLDAQTAALVASQQPDGSWGPCVSTRPNKKRHAVQTAAAALWAYRDE